MTIKEISKKTLLKFKSKDYIFTPKEYFEEFCKNAKQANVIVDDCAELPKLVKKLDKKYQKLIQNYKINSTYDLAFFLIQHLNRENISQDKEILASTMSYLKRVLQVVEMLPILESQKIASKQLDYLKPSLTNDEIELLRKEWLDFMTNYDDTIIKKLQQITKSSEKDIFKLAEKVIEISREEPDFSNLIDSIIFTLTPSFANFMSDEIVILKKQLKDSPSLVTSKNFIEELKILTKKRIKKDKDELKIKFRDINGITEKLSSKILKILKINNGSSKEIKTISQDLQDVKIHKNDIEVIREKLISITINLDDEINKFSEDIKKEDEEIKVLRKKVSLLENQLEELRKESKEDYLTKLLTKRALDDAINKQESLYERFNRNYSVIFFDIDHFKNVNDTYGHDAGDVILKSVGLLLNRYSREIDIVGRFGGEEFLALLPETDKNGAKIFAEKVNKVIKKTKFIYKKTRIDITISAGVAERFETNSSEETIKLADERVYKAKKAGRDRVVSE